MRGLLEYFEQMRAFDPRLTVDLDDSLRVLPVFEMPTKKQSAPHTAANKPIVKRPRTKKSSTISALSAAPSSVSQDADPSALTVIVDVSDEAEGE